MLDILVKKPKNESLVAQLGSLYLSFQNVPKGERAHFDLSELDWACPLLLLPLATYIGETGSTYTPPASNKVAEYLNAVGFPLGVDSLDDFETQTQLHKSYISISVLKKERGVEREKLEMLFCKMVYKSLSSIGGAQNAVYQPIGEFVTNIFEHSHKDSGYLFGQHYSKKNYLDICIVDCGKGFAQSYKDAGHTTLSSEDAISEVMRGVSTKPSRERGFGVWTSKDIVCKALGGDFIILSGSAAFIAQNSEEKLVTLPNFNWQGVLVAYRIPEPKGPIDITPYVE